MGRFLERCKTTRLTHKEMENLNRCVKAKGLNQESENFLEEKPGADCVTGELPQTFFQKLTPILHRPSLSTEKEGTVIR